MRRAVFLDRDGVLNPMVERGGRLRAPLALEDFRPFPWAGACVGRLRAAGFLALVVSNQPDVATGGLAPATLEGMHRRLREATGVDGIYVCPHADADGCDCRKPRPGLLRAAARERGVDLGASWLVGDRWRDVEAGRAAGCATILVDGPVERPVVPDHRAADLREAVTIILTRAGGTA
jgi:D-glycero-D-manno-heptose 1,7-bisphosphate phosphatase